MSCRLVTRFADDMARELDANDHKQGWDSLSVRQCLRRAEQEMGELRRAIEAGRSFKDIRSEAADVGNFLAMLVWNAIIP
jgi:NTP pyrophosphatase (non-canonical NTP hydrolase)